ARLVLGGGSGADAVGTRFSAFGRTNRGCFDLTDQTFLATGASGCGAGVTTTGSAFSAASTRATSAGGFSGTGFGGGFLAGLEPLDVLRLLQTKLLGGARQVQLHQRLLGFGRLSPSYTGCCRQTTDPAAEKTLSAGNGAVQVNGRDECEQQVGGECAHRSVG